MAYIHPNTHTHVCVYVRVDPCMHTRPVNGGGCFVQLLEKLLPPRHKVDVPTGEHVEEVNLTDYETVRSSARGGAARGAAVVPVGRREGPPGC